MKNGSKCDKIFFCFLIAFYIIASGLLFYSNLMVKNLVCYIGSIIIWILFFMATYSFQQSIYKSETKIYSKHSTHEINFLDRFEQNLEDFGIMRKDYNLYIDYFAIKLNLENAFRTNEIVLYLSTIVCPILINAIPDERKFESAVFGSLGILIIPIFMFIINYFFNRKKYMYSSIIYYLKLGLLSEQYMESQT